jgi:dolichyl-phosphate-mannose-protein mannosyltransferase
MVVATVETHRSTPGTELPPFARSPVLAAATAAGVALISTSGEYGYERDELYFRLLRPSWGYLDQPPLTPLLAHGISRVIDQPWAIRLPGTVAAVLTIVILASVTRELGGGRFAQTLCAWGYAFAALPLAVGHALLTATTDMPVWPAVLLFVIRAVKRDQPRWWLAAGVITGVSMYNKLLVALVIVGLAAGMAAVGPRRLLTSRWVWAAVATALVIGSPNLIYQAVHDWPQFSVGHALAEHNGGSVRAQIVPLLGLMIGPPLVPIWIAGLVHLWRGPVRFVAVAFPVVLALVFVMGSQPYYELEFVAVLFAAGCVPTANWVTTARWKRGLVITVVAVNGVVSVLIGLPLVPLGVLGDTPIPSINQVAADSVGWPRYVDQVAAVYRSVPPAQRHGAVVITSNYGEAGAVDRYGPADGLPAVYSGQNALYYQDRPPAGTRTVVFVGGQYHDARDLFTHCAIRARLDNGVDVDNEEQDEPVAVCSGPRQPWTTLWPRLRHVD